MAKIWCISAPLYSHTDWGGFLKTAQALQAIGHEVIWVSEESLSGAIAAAGLPFLAVRKTGWLWPPPPAPDLTTIPSSEAVMLRYRRALDTWLSEDLVGEAVEALLDLAAQTGQPEMILTDPFLSASALAAEKLNVPMIVCGWLAQADLNDQFLFPVQRNLGSDSRERVNRLCARFGVSGSNFSSGPTPSILSPHLHINYFTRGWYAAEQDVLLMNNLFVGGAPTPAHDAPPEWLASIPPDVPLGLVTLGSVFTGDLGFFSWGAQALAREGLLPIAVIGYNPIEPDKKAELIRALPKGTRLLNWVPFEHVLPRVKLMIHHGGMGTTHAAVVHGLLQIVVPHAADQRVQARRVAQAKIGLNLTAHDVRQGMLWEGTRALIRDDTVQAACKALAAEMAALGGARRAAEIVHTLL